MAKEWNGTTRRGMDRDAVTTCQPILAGMGNRTINSLRTTIAAGGIAAVARLKEREGFFCYRFQVIPFFLVALLR
jgi:hypothetical protein